MFTAWFLERITARKERVPFVITQKWDFEISGLFGNSSDIRLKKVESSVDDLLQPTLTTFN